VGRGGSTGLLLTLEGELVALREQRLECPLDKLYRARASGWRAISARKPAQEKKDDVVSM